MLQNGYKAVVGLAIVTFAAGQSSAVLPTVNLGYEIHQASSFNVCPNRVTQQECYLTIS